MTMYSAVFSQVAVTVQQDFFELNAPATGMVKLVRVSLTQSTEVGDAQEEGLNISIKRGTTTTTSGSGGTTPTATVVDDPGAGAFPGTVEVNNTTKMVVGSGAITTVHVENWNVRLPFLYLPTPEERLTLAPSQRLTVELLTTPADSITVSGTIYFQLIG